MICSGIMICSGGRKDLGVNGEFTEPLIYGPIEVS